MDPSEIKTILGIIVVVVIGVVGFPLGGLAEDLMWMIGDTVVPRCDLIEGENWKEQCFDINSYYYVLKPIFQITGMAGGFFTGYRVAQKLDLI
jgi:hypothetical protein